MTKWTCKICGYIYDEAKEGVPFQDLPDSWVCPLCGADKASFSPAQGEKPKAPTAPVTITGDMKELSAGELSAVCSNLARGCEKQYKDREAQLYRELADFFAAAAPAAPDTDLEGLIRLVRQDEADGAQQGAQGQARDDPFAQLAAHKGHILVEPVYDEKGQHHQGQNQRGMGQ